jgi:hypothetical protein
VRPIGPCRAAFAVPDERRFDRQANGVSDGAYERGAWVVSSTRESFWLSDLPQTRPVRHTIAKHQTAFALTGMLAGVADGTKTAAVRETKNPMAAGAKADLLYQPPEPLTLRSKDGLLESY